jgi:CheY-like chemotaxis protein
MILADAQILVVDDEPALRDIFAKWLSLAGCGHITTAPNGEAALAALTASHFDLLISDVRMPVMDGVTLVRNLEPHGITIPAIIFVSGFGDIDIREMYHLGVQAFLSKPLAREDLLSVIRHALADRSDLWQTPLGFPPRQIMEIAARGVATADGQDGIRLGLGGFSALSPAPLSIGKVDFRVHLTDQDRYLAGQGYVRWNSRPDGAVGIEFTYIAPESRPWLLEALATLHPRAFIPTF